MPTGGANTFSQTDLTGTEPSATWSTPGWQGSSSDIRTAPTSATPRLLRRGAGDDERHRPGERSDRRGHCLSGQRHRCRQQRQGRHRRDLRPGPDRADPEWKLLAGLRYDYFKTTFDDRRTTLTPATTPSAATDLARTDKEFSPSAGSHLVTDLDGDVLPQLQLLLPAVGGNAGPDCPGPQDRPEHRRFSHPRAQRTTRSARTGICRRCSRSRRRSSASIATTCRNADGNGGFVQTGQQRTGASSSACRANVLPHWQVFGAAMPIWTRASRRRRPPPARSSHHPSWCRGTPCRCGTDSTSAADSAPAWG